MEMKKVKNPTNSLIEYIGIGKDDGICNGDSGGAVQIEKFDGINIIIAIASYGSELSSKCINPFNFVNVTSHIKWIESIAFNDF